MPALGTFGGSAPDPHRVSGGGGTAPLADAGSLAKRQAYGNVGDLPVNFRDMSVRVSNSAAISIPDATSTLLTFDTEQFDTDPAGLHSLSTNTGRLTATTAGKYLIWATVQFASNATGYRALFFSFNDTNELAQLYVPAINGAVTILSLATVYGFVVGDYIVARVFQNSGGALNVNSAGISTPTFGMIQLAGPV